MYSDDGAPVYCTECFNGDEWDIFAHAQDIDWSKNFLAQIYELFKLQPRVYQYRIGTVINSDYGNSVVNSKNAYLCFSVLDSEDVMYSENIDRSRNSIDCLSVQDLDQCSWNIISNKNYNCHFLVSSHSCIDSYFLYDCVNCQNCCLSTNQRNQQFVFKNKKLSKEEYQEAINNLYLDTYEGFEKAKKEFNIFYKNAIHKYAGIIASQNALGDIISNSKNIYKSYDVSDSCEDIRYSNRIIKSKEMFDCSFVLSGELVYECLSASGNTFKQICSIFCLGSKNIEYSLFCKNSSDCFGCVGLKNAQYCILNKQYSRDEYFIFVDKIKKFMTENLYIDSKGRKYTYGEFYPFEFSPYHYNETLALDNFPIGKEEALTLGYPWKEREDRSHAITLVVDNVPDSIHEVSESILTEVIACSNGGNQEYQCTTAFKIMPAELQFYKQKNLPLPRYCSNCRHYQRLIYKNSMQLYTRQCMNGCGNTFQSTYAPNRPEKVYCEACYQKEVS